MIPNDSLMNEILEDLDRQIHQMFDDVLGVAISKGYISVRESGLMLFADPDTQKIKARNSIVLEYKGAERIEELEKENAYLKKINGDLHAALSDFYEKTKVNTWLKQNKSE